MVLHLCQQAEHLFMWGLKSCFQLLLCGERCFVVNAALLQQQWLLMAKGTWTGLQGLYTVFNFYLGALS